MYPHEYEWNILNYYFNVPFKWANEKLFHCFPIKEKYLVQISHKLAKLQQYRNIRIKHEIQNSYNKKVHNVNTYGKWI